MGKKQLSYESYTIGWICALPIEQTAAIYMLDERHQDLRNPANDQNAYTLGRVGKHNVVIAGLPKGRIGNNNSATVATRLASTFPNIRIGLMVGVGGGTPKKTQLGDVVISCPGGQETGVIQWDMGKAEFGGRFRRIQPLAPPPPVLLTSLSKFEAEQGTSYANMHSYLDRLRDQPYVDDSFLKTDSLEDILYEPTYCHVDMEGDCSRCDKTKIDNRRLRRNKTKIHYGLIASGNKVIKDAILRDDLYREYGVLCIEMEAAGLMNDFPCVVIRGICDYADSHANNEWQNYAATVAAACAKAFLVVVPEQEIYKLQPAQASIAPSMPQEEGINRTGGYAANFSKFTATPRAAVPPLTAAATEKVKPKEARYNTKAPSKIYANLGEGKYDSSPSMEISPQEEEYLIKMVQQGGPDAVDVMRALFNNKRLKMNQKGPNAPQSSSLNSNPLTPPLSPERNNYAHNGCAEDGRHLQPAKLAKTTNFAPTQPLADDDDSGPTLGMKRSQTFPTNRYSSGGRAVFEAIEAGDIAAIKRLLEDGTDLEMADESGRTPLWRAVQIGQRDVIKILLDKGANSESENANGQNILGWAVDMHRNDIVELLGYN